MHIKQKRVINLDRHMEGIEHGTTVVAAVPLDSIERNILARIGFTDQIQVGESVLPSRSFGPVSRFNALGKYKVHRDQPKETAYRTVIWHWTEYHGQDRVEQSGVREVPYERYPRTLIPPPSVELQIAEGQSGEQLITGPHITYTEANGTQLKHIVNLFLEIFGECSLLPENLQTSPPQIAPEKVRHLNWDVLPQGEWPWEKVRQQIRSVVDEAPKGNREVINLRLETLAAHKPDFVAVGRAGFRGYIIYAFPQKNLYVLESTQFDNATYVFEQGWEQLSQMTKAELIRENLHKARLVHRAGWNKKIADLFKTAGT
jgi:hypothetical protein